MDDGGQTSIELLLVALIILAGSIAIASYYTNINGSITAMELLKVKVLEKTSELGYFAYIEKIDQTVSGSTINFTLYLKGDKQPDCGALGLVETGDGTIKDLIMDKTNFKTINIYLNEPPIPCQ